MKVVITGAGGMLGQELVAAADAVHHDVVGFTRQQLDITDESAVREAFQRELPAVVINAAAYTNVDGAESDEANAYRINDYGAGVVAAAAAEVGAKIVHVSTDYVFDGSKREPYVESDQTNAIGIYGKSKLDGEVKVIAANPRHLIVRTSWLFGLGGKNFVETMIGLATKQKEILVVADQYGCPTYTRHLAEAIVETIDFERLGTMHICGEGHCSWYEFAKEIFRQTQTDVTVLSGTTEMLGRPAPRPAFAAMVSERDDAPVLPRWDHGLHGYLLARADTTGSTAETLDTLDTNGALS
ncbi:MAG: dTDP-4-dehydrorhamnose reductase [Solirubrobacterales bacterium]